MRRGKREAASCSAPLPDRARYMRAITVFFLTLLGASLLAPSLGRAQGPSLPSQDHDGGRTWKTVDELSADERARVDLSENTPRHPTVPYLPAEPYPFQPPFTAEEMGYRAMEFTQRPRWSCVFANVWGSISAQGVLLNPGKSVAFMAYPEPAGEAAEFSTMEPHAFGALEEAAEVLCILDHDGTRTHLGPRSPLPDTGPEQD